MSDGLLLWCREARIFYFILLQLPIVCYGWLPDQSSKISNEAGQIAHKFSGNATYPDHFTILHQDKDYFLLGGRNTVYNLSVHDFAESREWRMTWPSTEAHSQLCLLKGKGDDDCQNYIRILVSLGEGRLLMCGTNSYKPLCRRYVLANAKYKVEKELEGIGVCPYDPEHNSTAVFSNGHVFSATVADFSGGDPLIYRQRQRTERSDLKQLNAPNFVGSIPYGDYIFFFYRETAVEYINCGKIIYSRVARVCKDDKGGPHQFGDRWTSFLKARLNCSMPGEYPFYFDEIQSTSGVVEGRYGSNVTRKIVYGTLTTPSNAIGGSAICAYSMGDIVKVFQGSFKQQENINANWLPVPKDKVPEPRPDRCVSDSRVLPENTVNFVKSHSLMEEAVPTLFGQPILVRVSLQYRFTAIVVDPQVQTANEEKYDVLYVGTDDGKVLKIVNIPSRDSAKAVVISENSIFPLGTPVKQLQVAPGYGRVIVVGKDDVRLANLTHCAKIEHCEACIALQDPHCAWDVKQGACVTIDTVPTLTKYLMQDILRGDGKKCAAVTDNKNLPSKPYDDNNIDNEILASVEISASDPLLKTSDGDRGCDDATATNQITGCAIQQRLVIYTAETLHIVVVGASLAGLLLGFVAGYLFSRRFHPSTHYPDVPFIEQHNHLDRLSGNPNGFLTPRANKTVNLVVNVPPASPPLKKDNLESSKDLNITSDGTLQKIKKTYI